MPETTMRSLRASGTRRRACCIGSTVGCDSVLEVYLLLLQKLWGYFFSSCSLVAGLSVHSVKTFALTVFGLLSASLSR